MRVVQNFLKTHVWKQVILVGRILSNYAPEVEQLVKKVMEQTGENRSAFIYFQSIVVSIQIGIASCILGLTR